MLKWTVHQLYQYQNKGLTFDEKLEGKDLMGIDPEIRDMSNVTVSGRADISSSRASFHLTIAGEMTLPCSRTLVDVKLPFHIETTETFLLKSTADYEEYEELHAIEGDVVDLEPVIKELILLEIPMQVFCDNQDVKGAAPQSGQDWQVVTEEENNNKVDPRLAVLQDFFKDKE